MPPTPRKPPPRTQGPNRSLLIAAGAAAVVVLVLVAASLLLRGGDDSTNDSGGTTGIEEASALLDGIPQDRAVLGSPQATVTLIQFEDMQCPVCRSYQAEGFPAVVDEYVRPGDLRLWSARERHGLPVTTAHDALGDALACAELYLAQTAELIASGPLSLRDVRRREPWAARLRSWLRGRR